MQKSFLKLVFLSWFVIMGNVCAHPHGWTKNTVFIFPEDGRSPWITAIEEAKKTISMAAYRLSDPKILEALSAAKKRGIQVNLLVEPAVINHDKGYSENSLEYLKSLDITVHAPSKRFSQVHYKMIIVDRSWGLIGTGNLDAESFDGVKNVPACRDFAVPVLKGSLIHEMLRVFEADCKDTRIVPRTGKLIWGPDQQRSVFLRMINGAKRKIQIYQQDIQDMGIVAALAGAARAGVDVQLIMTPYPFNKSKDSNLPNQELLKKAGAKVALNTKTYIHAKIMIVDNKEMYIGSTNFYTPSLDQARELGIAVDNYKSIRAVIETFEKDWKEAAVA